MREHKGFNTNNERRELVLTNLDRLFNIMNKTEANSGNKAESEIADRFKVVYLGELSTSTLIKEYERLLGNTGVIKTK